jgi:hypothetical protein
VKINFDAIESRLKSLIESSSHLISGRSAEDVRRLRLVEAMRDYLQDHLSSGDEFPESLICVVAQSNLTDWQDYPFNETLESILKEAGKPDISLPQISVACDSELLDGEILIRGGKQFIAPLDKTASMPSVCSEEDDLLGDCLPENAFIIVNGLETIQLTQSVLNIGRRMENDLVLEDPRISRDHAQIRAVKGQYVIFDLNSSGGTFVNSIRISRQPLYPGDVISLAGVPLVYGQDNPPPHAKTGPVEPFFDPAPREKL